jgi:hypothetical protein
MSETDASGIVAALGVIIALSVGYGRLVGPLQTELSQAFIDAFAVPSHYKRLLNFGVGLTLGIALSVIGALAVGSWALVPAGIVAGVLASVEASRTYDQAGAFDAGVQTGIHEARTVLRRVPPNGGGTTREVA